MSHNLPDIDIPQPDFNHLAIQAGQYFNPNTPVNERNLFSGRTEQIRRIIDAIFQRGQHVIIFGERGVGKTSLANVLSSFVSPNINLLPTRINCDAGDNFETVWKKVFEEMHIISTKPGMGFNAPDQVKHFIPKDFFREPSIAPNDVRKAIIQISSSFLPLIIIDEFDRLKEDVRKLFADLIKSLSDYSLNATVVLIGVGSNVEQLIEEHESVSRSLVQISMPRMNPDEIRAIITNALNYLGMNINENTLMKIVSLSKGLPHYTHLIGLHATRSALDNSSLMVTDSNLENAIKKSIADSQHSIITDYYKAIKSSYKNNLFSQIILACALAPVNELGEFSAQDLRIPLKNITGKNYDIPNYAQHLKEFSESRRGNILIKSGERRFYKYKFAEPLMQPFIVMQGIVDKKVSPQSLI